MKELIDIPARIEYPERDGKLVAETELHVKELLALIGMLDTRYWHDPRVYVSGNMFIYYEEGDIKKRVSPDVFVVLGVPKTLRRVYRLWEEREPPTVVFEVSSRKTRREDAREKKDLCARLGVKEYFLYDPAAEYLRPPLQGFRLKAGEYHPIRADAQGVLKSDALGLKLQLVGGRLRLIDAATGKRLLRLNEAEAAREEAEAAREEAVAEIKRLRAENERLRKFGR